MSESRQSGGDVSVSVSGGVNAPIAAGHNIDQRVDMSRRGLAGDDLAQMRQLFAELSTQVAAEAPPEQQQEALAKVKELEQATTAEKPNVTTMAYVCRWFKTNLPKLAGAVLSVVVNPIVGSLVTATGESLAAVLKQRIEE